jgi:hypothetical protein
MRKSCSIFTPCTSDMQGWRHQFVIGMASRHERTLHNMRDRSRRALSVIAMAAAEATSQTAPASAADAPHKATRRVTYTSYEVNTWQATFEQSGASPQHTSWIWCICKRLTCSMPPCRDPSPAVSRDANAR